MITQKQWQPTIRQDDSLKSPSTFWPVRLVAFLNKVSEIERHSDVPDFDKQQLTQIGQALGDLLTRVADLSEQQPTTEDLIQQLIASYDRMNEELAKATALSDRIASKP